MVKSPPFYVNDPKMRDNLISFLIKKGQTKQFIISKFQHLVFDVNTINLTDKQERVKKNEIYEVIFKHIKFYFLKDTPLK